MKKGVIFVMILSILGTASVAVAAGRTIARFAKDTMFIEAMAFSPGGKHIALQARDGKRLYTSAAHIWLGNAQGGTFRKMYAEAASRMRWISEREIAFLDKAALYSGTRDVVVKAVDIGSGAVRELYRRTPRLQYGWQPETINLLAISATGRYLLMQDSAGFHLQDLQKKQSVYLKGFSISLARDYSVAFSGNDERMIVYDGQTNAYSLYRISPEGGLEKARAFQPVTGKESLTPFVCFDPAGEKIIFAAERCEKRCSLSIYSYDPASDKRTLKDVLKGGKILAVAWSPDLKKTLVNNFHRELVIRE